MQYLWEHKLKNCSWETLRYEFVQKFQTNDPRVIDKYLGHPEETVRHAESSVVRQNRNSGTVAHFMYANQRTVKTKRGLLEELGYITREGRRYILHHENFGYFTEQVALEVAISLPEVNGQSGESIHNLRVCGPLGENDDKAFSQGERARENRFEKVVSPIETAERKEEEDIDSTHTNQSSESEAGKEVQTRTEHTSEVRLTNG